MATITNETETATELITVEQWAAIEPPPNFELIDGMLKEKPAGAVWHDILLARLLHFLTTYVYGHSLGEFVSSTTPLKVSAFHGRKPDIFFIPKSMFSLVGKNLVRCIPPLAIEIISPSNEREDRVSKKREYASLGIGQYWIVDFPRRQIEVFQLRDQPNVAREYVLVETVSGDSIFRPSFFPGLEIPLAKIWPTEFENAMDE
jgi:Uma2 family endonuclease